MANRGYHCLVRNVETAVRSSRVLQSTFCLPGDLPVPTSLLNRLFREKKFKAVSLSGQATPLSPGTLLSPGECVVTRETSIARLLQPKLPTLCPHQPWVSRDTIIFSTPSLLAIQKPAGVDTQRSGLGRWSVEDALPQISALTESRGSGEEPLNKLRILHRLDTPVSGVLLLARTLDCAREVSSLLRERDCKGIQKGYLGMVVTPSGKSFSSSSLNSKFPLGLITSQVKTKDNPAVHESGTSRFCVLAQGHSKGHCLHVLGLSPLTGRRHQLRQHVTALFQGTGLYGDERYGGAPFQAKVRGLGLHASAVNVTFEGVEHQIHCPLPAWWAPVLRSFGLSTATEHSLKEHLRDWMTRPSSPSYSQPKI
jgi:23S rRNA-/tRNA-specific pseudouridylate synthase